MSDWQKITEFTVYGNPASKANSRRSVPRKGGGGNLFIKSPKAMAFEFACQHQIPVLPEMLDAQGMEVWVCAKAFYPDLRSDLDMSILYDRMQSRLFQDDVCITRMTTFRGYGGDPRVEVSVFARPWLIDGKMPKLKINEPLRRRLRAEKIAASGPPKASKRSRKS